MNKFENILIKEVQAIITDRPVNTEGSVSWSSPSNIAIVKYWGKRPGQIPANASVSMTLSEAVSKTKIAYTYSQKRKALSVKFKFEGKEHKEFGKRIGKSLDGLIEIMPWLSYMELSITSQNTFPHSSGIASSASAMSALAVCLCEIEELLYGKRVTGDFYKKASFVARLGSGSASRSVYGNMAVWGMTACQPLSSDEYAIPLKEIHDDFLGMKDSILIIESGKKSISSSLGHDLMKSNPYARLRFEAAEENMQRLCGIIKSGDISSFIDILENEALSLHAMMMTSSPGYLLMKPNTLEAIERIRMFRMETGTEIGFTLDAGANVHVLYPEKSQDKVKSFIESELKPLCQNEMIIHDCMGSGPNRI